MTIPAQDLGPGVLPDLEGGIVEIGDFTIRPASGPVGATLELTFEFDEMIPGLTSVQVFMGGEKMGDPVPVQDVTITARRTVPDLPSTTHEVTVAWGEVTLASTEFSVVDAPASGSSPVLFLGLAAVAAGLGWRATRHQHQKSSFWKLGPVDTWYAWRESRRP